MNDPRIYIELLVFWIVLGVGVFIGNTLAILFPRADDEDEDEPTR